MAVPIDAHDNWILYDGMNAEVLIHTNDTLLDGAFQVMDYPLIQLVFELVPNNIEFLSAPKSSSRRIKYHRIKADHYIQKYATDMGEDDTSSAGGYMSDGDPYCYNFLQAGDYVMYLNTMNYHDKCCGWISSINEERRELAVQIEGTMEFLHSGDHIKVLCRQTEDTTLRNVNKPFWEAILSSTTIGRQTYNSGVASRRTRRLRESMANAQRDIENFDGVG
jgi:hypothetical protein